MYRQQPFVNGDIAAFHDGAGTAGELVAGVHHVRLDAGDLPGPAGQRDEPAVPDDELAGLLVRDEVGLAERAPGLEPELRRHCPELGEAQRAAVARVLAGARNEWVRATTDLITGAIDALPDDDEDDQLALDMPAESLPPAA